MDLYIERDQLIRGLARVQGVVERRTTNPVLSHVLLSARGDALQMTATDSALTLVADYPATVETSGELSVDAQRLFQIARTLTDSTVHLSLSKANRLHVKCGKAEFNVVGSSPDDYPPVPTRDERARLTVSGGDLRRIIEETLASISADDNRYGLNGGHLEQITTEDGQTRLRLVTTDGSRLSWSEIEFEGDFGLGARMLIPRKALGEVRKLVELDDARWTVSFGQRAAAFSTDGVTLMLRLIDGEFPPYRDVLPPSAKRLVRVQRGPFSQALKRVSIMASDRNHSVRFAFDEDKLVMTAHNVDAGDVREELPADLEGAPIFTGFNVRYFQDILAATRGDELVLELGEPLDPCLVRIPERDDCMFVVMPMRLD
jgi:DNA polymerase-3 subunit beta